MKFKYLQKYEFLTNPGNLAEWPLGLTTTSIVDGQMNNIPLSQLFSWAAIESIDHELSHTSRQ